MYELFRDGGGVLYLGASVTAQKEGYRPKLHELISREVRKSIPMYVNSLGGIGSMFGLANWRGSSIPREDIKLVIFEYSTGDLNIGITPLDIMEDILDEFFYDISAIGAKVFVVHNYRSDFEGDKGNMVREVYNRQAARYGYPVIRMDKIIENNIRSDVEWLVGRYRDHVHTTEAGSEYVAREIFEFIQGALVELSENPDLSKDLIAPMSAEFRDFKFCTLSELGVADASGEFTYSGTGQVFPFWEVSEKEQLVLKISGSIYGVVMIIGPRSCYTNIRFGNVAKMIKSFDRNCYYERPHCFPIRVSVDGVADIFIDQSEEKMDYSILLKDNNDTSLDKRLKIIGFIGSNMEVF